MLKLDTNFYVLPRGEQTAKMVEYYNRLTGRVAGEEEQPDLVFSGAHPEPVDDKFISDFLSVVARHYDWGAPEGMLRPAYTYNLAVQKIMNALLSDPFQDVDKHAAHFINIVGSSHTETKARRLAIVGLRTLIDPEMPFTVSYATAAEVADTLGDVVKSEPQDQVLGAACLNTMARLLEQRRVPFSSSFADVAAMPIYEGKAVFELPGRQPN